MKCSVMEKQYILCKSPISLTSYNDGVTQLSCYIQIKDLQFPNCQPFANCYCNCKSFYSKNTLKSHLQLDESFEGVSPAQSPLLTWDHIQVGRRVWRLPKTYRPAKFKHHWYRVLRCKEVGHMERKYIAAFKQFH